MSQAAQKAVARALAKHSHKDGRTWELLVVTSNSDATSIAQGTSAFTPTVIDPVVQQINEHEAQYIGPNIREGDLRLILPGSLEITTKSVLKANDETVDILRVIPSYQKGVIQEYKVYVRRRPEAQGGS